MASCQNETHSHIISSLCEVVGFPDTIPRDSIGGVTRKLRVLKTYIDESTGVLVRSSTERIERIQAMCLALDEISQKTELTEVFNLLYDFEKVLLKSPVLPDAPPL